MPGKKRSERQRSNVGAGAPTVTLERETEPKTEPASATGEYRAAICPVCGRTAGRKRRKYPYEHGDDSSASENFWEYTKHFDPNKPFGVIQAVGGGKGHSFQVLGHFGPEDDPDGYFPLVKARLLNAVKEWVAKGWISPEEADEALHPEAAYAHAL
jgi:hypothetical protein